MEPASVLLCLLVLPATKLEHQMTCFGRGSIVKDLFLVSNVFHPADLI